MSILALSVVQQSGLPVLRSCQFSPVHTALLLGHWFLLSHCHTAQGRSCGASHKLLGLSDADRFACGEAQTMSHSVNDCPQVKIDDGLRRLCMVDRRGSSRLADIL